MSNQYNRRRRSWEQKRAEACKLYGWPNDPRYWDSRYARWQTEPEPEPDIYLLQTQTASNLLIGAIKRTAWGVVFWLRNEPVGQRGNFTVKPFRLLAAAPFPASTAGKERGITYKPT